MIAAGIIEIGVAATYCALVACTRVALARRIQRGGNHQHHGDGADSDACSDGLAKGLPPAGALASILSQTVARGIFVSWAG